MARIALMIMAVVAFMAVAVTCDRANVYDLAINGPPPKSALYLYHTATLFSGNIGGRDELDKICFDEGIQYVALIGASNVKAFISTYPVDEMRFLIPAAYWSYPIFGLSESFIFTPIAATWYDLFDGTTINNINSALGIGGQQWWSGSFNDGSLSTSTCNGWHDGSNLAFGQVGGALINEEAASCEVPHHILCIAY